MSHIYSYTQEQWDRYTFISVGRQGEVRKVVTFKQITEIAFNVVLQDEFNGELSDDITVTDNGDALKVINTVALIIKEFIDFNPGYGAHIAGSDPRRNRIYQRQISRELASDEYILLAATELGGDFDFIDPYAQYKAFLVFRR